MKTTSLVLLLLSVNSILGQGFGIVRKNYFSSYYDPLIMMDITTLDSSTIRLGTINTSTGEVSNVGADEYTMGINLTGSTINPYSNHYIISSGGNLLTFDMTNGTLLNSAEIQGSIPTFAFQNYRFNPSDSIIYGMVPENFYSMFYDSLSMMEYEVLDSSHIRFAKIDPTTGEFELIGNQTYKNIYTLAGNSIDPHQMVYYYSAVDTLVGIDLYNGGIFSQVPIQLPYNTLFENFTYSCSDTSIYGLVRENFIVSVYDSLLGIYLDQIDSVTIKLGKINPNDGAVTIISPTNLGLYATLNGSCFIEPGTMTYYFSTGNQLVGVSLQTGLITSTNPMLFSSTDTYFDMMRSNQNCYGAIRAREDEGVLGMPNQPSSSQFTFDAYPNPANNTISIQSTENISYIAIYDMSGKVLLQSNELIVDVSSLNPGLYLLSAYSESGQIQTLKLIKD